jgi:MFS transporter, MHS family, proline/betaine transporter
MGQLANIEPTLQVASSRKLLVAVGIGNALEWFDFAIYGLFAPQIAANFFPSHDPLTGLLDTFAVLALAFLARPIGGLVFGVIGDRRGRRYALALAVVLMGAGTAAIGVLPTHAQVGALAPALLICCRIVQGISAGGEYNSATAFITEHAPSHRRGMHASVVGATVALSTVLGTATSLFVLAWFSTKQIDDYGWRVPFILVGLISVLGLYLRMRMEETPVYREFQARQEQRVVESAPLSTTLRAHVSSLVTISCAAGIVGLVTYIFLGYMASHLQVNLRYSPRQALGALMIGATVQLLAVVAFGRVIDRVNRRRWFLLAAGAAVLAPLPLYEILPNGYPAVVSVMCVLGTLVASLGICYNLLTVEMLPTEIRVSGGAVAYNVAYVVFGGTAPYVATWVTRFFGSPLAPAVYMVVVAAVLTLVLVRTLPDTSDVGTLDELDVRERATR